MTCFSQVSKRSSKNKLLHLRMDYYLLRLPWKKITSQLLKTIAQSHPTKAFSLQSSQFLRANKPHSRKLKSTEDLEGIDLSMTNRLKCWVVHSHLPRNNYTHHPKRISISNLRPLWVTPMGLGQVLPWLILVKLLILNLRGMIILKRKNCPQVIQEALTMLFH